MTRTVELPARVREAVYGRVPDHIKTAAADLRNARDTWRWAQVEIRRSTNSEWTQMLMDERSAAFNAMGDAANVIGAYSPTLVRELLAGSAPTATTLRTASSMAAAAIR